MRTDPVREYATKVLDGKIVAGPYVRAACARHLRDLDTASSRGLWWDFDAALRVFGFFEETLVFGEAQFDQQPFILHPSQKFIVGSLFGWKHEDGSRRFQEAYIEAGKSNGKTPLAAGIGLYLLCADGEIGPKVMCAAPTKDQAAKLAFQDAVGFVERNEELSSVIRKKGDKLVEALHYDELNGEMSPISADSKRKSGFRPSAVIVDEIHELPQNDELIPMLQAGFKFRRNPLLFKITNSGFDRKSACWKHRERAVQAVMAGRKDDDALFSYVCALDEGDDPLKDEKCWHKANPLLGSIIHKPYIRNQITAMRALGKVNICLRLNFCVWTGAGSTWLPPETIESGFKEVTPEQVAELKGAKCRGAIDLSKFNDLTALTLGWRLSDDRTLLRSWFFFPQDNLREKIESDAAPYDEWSKSKKSADGTAHLQLVPGPEVDFQFLARKIADLDNEFDIEYLCFDPYKIEDLRRELDGIGCKIQLYEHLQNARKTRQTGFWMPGAIAALESALLTGKIIIEENPVMRACLRSVETKMIDDQGNRIFSKQRSRWRIDGAVTAAMTQGALINGPKAKVPQLFFIGGEDET